MTADGGAQRNGPGRMRAVILWLHGAGWKLVSGVIMVCKDCIAGGGCRKGTGASKVTCRLAGDEVTGEINDRKTTVQPTVNGLPEVIAAVACPSRCSARVGVRTAAALHISGVRPPSKRLTGGLQAGTLLGEGSGGACR